MRIARILRDTRLDARGKRLSVWSYVIHNELQSGTQFVLAQPGGQMYAVLGESNEVVRVPSRGGSAWFGYLNATYGLTEREQYMTVLHDCFRHYIQRHGIKSEMRRLSKYDTETNTAYLSSYDGRMFKIDGERWSRISNGEDGVFFADDDGGRPLVGEPDVGPHGILLETLTAASYAPSGLSGITPEQQRKALAIWVLSLAFPDLLIDKPILMVEGVRGSGKTSCVTHAQLVITGSKHPIVLQRNKEDDFGVILMRSPIALFDNLDSYIDWVPDVIAGYCTGAKWEKRKLFTDDENLVIKPHSFIAVATRNPASFRRDDVADRCLILRFERRQTFTDRGTLENDLLSNRPALFGEYLYYVGQIIELIRRDGGMSSRNERFRMASFAALARVIGRVLQWEDGEVDRVLDALAMESDAFTAEEDPLIDLLNHWLKYKTQWTPSNVGRLVTANQLHAELESLAQAHQIQWKDTPRSLQQKLRSTAVERAFQIEPTVLEGQRVFKLWRHGDPRLELVPNDAPISITEE